MKNHASAADVEEILGCQFAFHLGVVVGTLDKIFDPGHEREMKFLNRKGISLSDLGNLLLAARLVSESFYKSELRIGTKK